MVSRKPCTAGPNARSRITSPFTTLIAEKVWRASKVPVEAAFSTPDSVTATEPVTENVSASCAVSFVTEVVTREAVAAARERPDVAVSV